MKRDKKINYIIKIILIFFVLGVFIHYIKGGYYGLIYPHNTFLFKPNIQFTDFLNDYNNSKDLNPYYTELGHGSNYFPFSNIFTYLFSFITGNKVNVALFLYISIFIGVFTIINYNQLKIENESKYLTNVIIITFLTYPFLYTIDRANSEMYVFIFTCCSILLFVKNKFYESGFLLSFAIAMKIAPVVFIILFLKKRRYKEFVFTISCVLFLTISSLLIFKGGFINNLNVLVSGFGEINWFNYFMNKYYFGSNNYIQQGVSLFVFFKTMFIKLNIINFINMVSFGKIYGVTVIILFIILCIYIIFIEKELWKIVTLLTFSYLLFPFMSGDYKLIFIFVPLYLFVNNKTAGSKDLFYVFMFSFLLIPMNYYYFNNLISDNGAHDISISILLNPLIMMSISGVIISEGLSKSYKWFNFNNFIKLFILPLSSVIVFLCIIGYWLLLTPSGNSKIKPYIESYIENIFKSPTTIQNFRLSSNNAIINIHIQDLLTGDLIINSVNNQLTGAYQIDILDTRKKSYNLLQLPQIFSVGEISGKGLNNINFDGQFDIFNSSGVYHLNILNRMITNIVFDFDSLHTDEIFTFINNHKFGLSGILNIHGQFNFNNQKFSTFKNRINTAEILINGSAKLTEKQNIISDMFGIVIPQNTEYQYHFDSDINNGVAVSNFNANSPLIDIYFSDNRITLMNHYVKSNYNIIINDIDRIRINESAKLKFMEANLPNFRAIKDKAADIYRGRISFYGKFFKYPSSKLSVNGIMYGNPNTLIPYKINKDELQILKLSSFIE